MTGIDLRGEVAVVVGGAGLHSGLGNGLVRRAAEAGMRVAILDLDGAAAQAIAESLRADGVEAIGIGADVTDHGGLERAAAEVEDAFGACNVLFANVGGGIFHHVDEVTLDQWRRSMEIMVVGTVGTVQAFLPLMRKTTDHRRIVLTASIAAISPGRFQGPYRAAKAAVTSIGETLDLELAEEGIRTTVAFPGGMVSDAHIDFARDMLARQDPRTPPTDDAQAMQFAVSAEMTGVPADLATGYEAAGSFLDAVKESRHYVVTHGLTAVAAARRRHEALERAFEENAAREGRPVDPGAASR